jgi:HK97 family phage major capsid protein
LIGRDAVNGENRTVELAFSSEVPYERYFGFEILDHSEKSVRLNRLKDASPLLLNHDTDKQIGVVESVIIGSDRIGRAKVRFGKSVLAEEIFQDVQDGIRQKVSVGYMVHAMQIEGKDAKFPSYRVSDWEPFEVSIVSIPADTTVGVDRTLTRPTQEETAMNTVLQTDAQPSTPSAPLSDAQVKNFQEDVRQKELKRIEDIRKVGDTFKSFGGEQLAHQMIVEGKGIEDLRTILLERAGAIKPVETAELGMTQKEVKKYSFVKAIHALANPMDAQAQKNAGYELELSSTAREKGFGNPKANFVVPYDVLKGQKRDLVVGTNTAGGHTVQTDLLADSFIDLLRNKLILSELGTTLLMGLQGNVAIPKLTGSATAYWVAEGSDVTASQQTFGQVALTPKTIGAITGYSRRMLLQSSLDIETFVMNDLAQRVANGIEANVFSTTAGDSTTPEGLLHKSIGSVAGGTNGSAVAWSHIVGLESAVAIANADVGNLAYVTNPSQRGKMKQASKVSGQNGFIWADGDTPVNGYKAAVTNNVPSTLTKGTATSICSAVIFGNWADLLIGMWGGLSLMVDPYTDSASGNVRIVVMQDVDIAVRNNGSFAMMLDAL